MEKQALGLNTQQAEEYLKTHGPNSIPEKTDSAIQKLLAKMFSPISLMLLAASLLSFFIHKTFDGNFILFLLFMNLVITIWQENKADAAIKKLNDHLKQSIKTLRDGKWISLDSTQLVPGDIVELTAGDIVPADGKLVEGKHVTVNESVLTGESLPKEKDVGDQFSSGTFLTTGIAQVEITETGAHTKLGKTLFSVERIRKQSLLEKDVIRISQFLSVLSLIAVAILSFIFWYQHAPILELLTLDLSLLIAGIPISLPTVMTLIIEFGVLELSKKDVIVRRISALEDLANVNLLLTDKTGTLTENKITIRSMTAYDSWKEADIISFALPATIGQDHDPIDTAIRQKADELALKVSDWSVSDFIPPDSTRKRSTVIAKHDGKTVCISLGAPQIIASVCDINSQEKKKLKEDVTTYATQGFRALAVAVNTKNTDESHMKLVGIMALSDTLRQDAADVIQFLEENGITVSMVTGDHEAIASEVATKLHLDDGKVMTKPQLDAIEEKTIAKMLFSQTGAFAQILPEDKLKLVRAAKRYFVVAATGDGINDLAAIKAANVGVAVKNAANALKAAADIVLLTSGIAVVKDAIIESRKIFTRIYSYSVYRISESLRLIVSIAVLGFFYKVYPLTPLQLVLLALLNDIPIISLAWDRVRTTKKPAAIDVKKRFILSSLLGTAGIANSLILFFIMTLYLHLSWPVIQTLFFLKLTVSGHLLIYVARTKERWWRFLPSREVIWATFLTQLLASLLALTGFFMPARVSWQYVMLVWLWSFFWMQVSEVMKIIQLDRKNPEKAE